MKDTVHWIIVGVLLMGRYKTCSYFPFFKYLILLTLDSYILATNLLFSSIRFAQYVDQEKISDMSIMDTNVYML